MWEKEGILLLLKTTAFCKGQDENLDKIPKALGAGSFLGVKQVLLQ